MDTQRQVKHGNQLGWWFTTRTLFTEKLRFTNSFRGHHSPYRSSSPPTAAPPVHQGAVGTYDNDSNISHGRDVLGSSLGPPPNNEQDADALRQERKSEARLQLRDTELKILRTLSELEANPFEASRSRSKREKVKAWLLRRDGRGLKKIKKAEVKGEKDNDEKKGSNVAVSATTAAQEQISSWDNNRSALTEIYNGFEKLWDRIPKNQHKAVFGLGLDGSDTADSVWEACYEIAHVLAQLPRPKRSPSKDTHLDKLLGRLKKLVISWNGNEASGDYEPGKLSGLVIETEQELPVGQVIGKIKLQVQVLESRLDTVLAQLDTHDSASKKPTPDSPSHGQQQPCIPSSFISMLAESPQKWAADAVEFGTSFEASQRLWTQARSRLEVQSREHFDQGNILFMVSDSLTTVTEGTSVRSVLQQLPLPKKNSNESQPSDEMSKPKPEQDHPSPDLAAGHMSNTIWSTFRGHVTRIKLSPALSKLPTDSGIVEAAVTVQSALALLKNLPSWTILTPVADTDDERGTSKPVPLGKPDFPTLIQATFIDQALTSSLNLFDKLMRHVQTTSPNNDVVSYVLGLVYNCLERLSCTDLFPGLYDLLVDVAEEEFSEILGVPMEKLQHLFSAIRKETVGPEDNNKDKPMAVATSLVESVSSVKLYVGLVIPTPEILPPLYLLCLSVSGRDKEGAESLDMEAESLGPLTETTCRQLLDMAPPPSTSLTRVLRKMDSEKPAIVGAFTKPADGLDVPAKLLLEQMSGARGRDPSLDSINLDQKTPNAFVPSGFVVSC